MRDVVIVITIHSIRFFRDVFWPFHLRREAIKNYFKLSIEWFMFSDFFLVC